ncbi:MAG: bifunctional oligoribonuclease/PAP phosphatase NrnA [Patescibacteria group bacterium]|nr:bifunctional oligoribonuclease/PAP phosphatase NrnA [Patescibacteria group bacterium]
MDTSLYTKAYSQIKTSNNILVVTHEQPDGDALASLCLMAEILTQLNKKYTLYCYDRVNHQYGFLPHLNELKNSYENFDFDLIIVLDCGSVERTKLDKEILSRRPNQLVIEIDHHPKIKGYADLEIRDSAAAATTEILYYFLKANKIKINKDMAGCVLTGILTDTGNFLYPSTSPETINIASEMLVNGAKLPQIMENTWRNKSIASMKTWGKAMARLKINPQYKFGFTVLKSEDVPAEVTEEELEGMSGFLSNLNDVNGILLLRELPDGRIKGSLRTSKPNVDISKLARALGGGGHAKAAGFTVEGKIEETDKGWKII